MSRTLSRAPTNATLGQGLPTLPSVAKALADAVIVAPENPSGWNHAIGRDPALCVRLLRLANSSYFGSPHQVFALERVAAILGATMVRGAALTAPVLDGWEEDIPDPVIDIWVHSQLTARAAGHMALRLVGTPDLSTPEVLWAAGLMHDIGKIHLLSRQPRLYAEMLAQTKSDRSLGIAEKDAYGRDHAELGADLMEQWGLPPRLYMAAMCLERGGLREQYRADMELLRVAHALALTGRTPTETGWVSPALVADTALLIEQWRQEAEAFCRGE